MVTGMGQRKKRERVSKWWERNIKRIVEIRGGCQREYWQFFFIFRKVIIFLNKRKEYSFFYAVDRTV